MVSISEVPKMRDQIDVEGTIESIGEPRTVNLRTGGENQVADAVLKDDSGQVKLTLWGEDINKIKVGSKIQIKNGYTKEFKGEIALNVGRYGTLTVSESS